MNTHDNCEIMCPKKSNQNNVDLKAIFLIMQPIKFKEQPIKMNVRRDTLLARKANLEINGLERTSSVQKNCSGRKVDWYGPRIPELMEVQIRSKLYEKLLQAKGLNFH